MRLFSILTVLMFVLALPSQPAQAGILEFLFPTLRNAEPDPAVTLQAPFARDPEDQKEPYIPGTEERAEVQPLPENLIPLDKPHRNQGQIGDWIGPVAAAAMTFTNSDIEKDYEAVRPYFDANGFALYQQFLQKNKLTQVLDLNKYDIRAYVQEKPLLLNEAEVGGRYNWLFEVPVMVSYLERGGEGYQDADPVNQEFALRVQASRSDQTDDPMGVVIVHWDGKSKKLDKK